MSYDDDDDWSSDEGEELFEGMLIGAKGGRPRRRRKSKKSKSSSSSSSKSSSSSSSSKKKKSTSSSSPKKKKPSRAQAAKSAAKKKTTQAKTAVKKKATQTKDAATKKASDVKKAAKKKVTDTKDAAKKKVTDAKDRLTGKKKKKQQDGEDGGQDNKNKKKKKQKEEEQDGGNEPAADKKDDKGKGKKKKKLSLSSLSLGEGGDGGGGGGGGGGDMGGAAVGGGGGGSAFVPGELEPTAAAPQELPAIQESRATLQYDMEQRRRLAATQNALLVSLAESQNRARAAELELQRVSSAAAAARAQAEIDRANQRISELEAKVEAARAEARTYGLNPNDIDGDGRDDTLVARASLSVSPTYVPDEERPAFGFRPYTEDADPDAVIERMRAQPELDESGLEDAFEGAQGDLAKEDRDRSALQLVPASSMPTPPRRRNAFERVMQEQNGTYNGTADWLEKITRVPGNGFPANPELDPKTEKMLHTIYPEGSAPFPWSKSTWGKRPPRRSLLELFGNRDESDTGDGSLSVAAVDPERSLFQPAAATADTIGEPVGDNKERRLVARAPEWVPTKGMDAYQLFNLLLREYASPTGSFDSLRRVIPLQFWRAVEAVPGISAGTACGAYKSVVRLAQYLAEQDVENATKELDNFATVLGLKDVLADDFKDFPSALVFVLENAPKVLRPGGKMVVRDTTATSWPLENVLEDLGVRITHMIMMEDEEAARHELEAITTTLETLRTTSFYERMGVELGDEFLNLLLAWVRAFGVVVFDLNDSAKRTQAMKAAKDTNDWLSKHAPSMVEVWHAYIRYLINNVSNREGAPQFDNLRLMGRALDREPEAPAEPIEPIPPLDLTPEEAPSPQEYQRARDVQAVERDSIPEDRRLEDVALSMEGKDTTLERHTDAPTSASMMRGPDPSKTAKEADELRGRLDVRCFIVQHFVRHSSASVFIKRSCKTVHDAWIWLRYHAPDSVWAGLDLSKERCGPLETPSSSALFCVRVAPLLCAGFCRHSLRTDRVSFQAECCERPEQFMVRVRRAVTDEPKHRRVFVENLCDSRFHLAHELWVRHSPVRQAENQKLGEKSHAAVERCVSECPQPDRDLFERLYKLVLVRHAPQSAAHSILALHSPATLGYFDTSFEACF